MGMRGLDHQKALWTWGGSWAHHMDLDTQDELKV